MRQVIVMNTNLKDCLRGTAAVCIMTFGFCAGTQTEALAQDAEVGEPVADSWTAMPADTATVVRVSRTVALEGGGQMSLRLSCDFRPNADPVMNGFWLKLEGTFTGTDGTAPMIDADAITDGQAYFATARSTGEDGQMMAASSDPSHFTYDNNQTNELNNDNNDPAKVELATRIDIPLSDGRILSIHMHKDDDAYADLLTRCAMLAPK